MPNKLSAGFYDLLLSDRASEALDSSSSKTRLLDIAESARLAENGVDDHVSMLWDFGTAHASLATSYRCKLPNEASIIGTEGTIRIPDFWRARECSLFHRDERIDHFSDGRAGSGFEFEIEAVSSDIAAGRLSSAIVPLQNSLRVQIFMDRIRSEFPALIHPGARR